MYNNNNHSNSAKLKINPKYEVQIRGLIPCEYKMLRNSMQMVGQRIPIIADKDGNIIAGHHRFKICRELGIEPEFETQDFESEEQKLKTIIDVNSARRHYNKWELFESVMTKKPVIEVQVKAEQQIKYPKPGEKGLKPISDAGVLSIDR
jgi:ParB-like nuclease domain